MENQVNKNNIFKYSFYDENQKLVVVLDEEYLKELFKADYLVFKEDYEKYKIGSEA